MPRKHAWHRVLYEHQPYPDNYIDPLRFLDQLRVVTPVVNLSAGELLFNSIMVVEELTSVALFVTVYLYLMRPGASAWPLISLETIVMVAGYFTLKLYDSELLDIRTAVWNIAIFCCYVRIIAPILQSLTSSYSDDTIYALSLLFSTVHMLTQDYKYMRNVTQRFSGTLSLNAAMFTAVLLASRFESLDKTSGFMGLAMIIYYVMPSVIRFLYARSPIAYVSTAATLWAIVTVLLAKLDRTLFVAYESIVFFVLVISPFGLRFVGGIYKRSLRGPWDIADIPEVDGGKED
jgi:phosphatidylinositol glycan class C protein